MRASMEEIAYYIALKQSLLSEFKGRTYSHALNITKNVLYFFDKESLYSRMVTYSSSLIKSMIKNQMLIQAPLIDNKLVYVHRDIFPYFYYYNKPSNEIQFDQLTHDILEKIQTTNNVTLISLSRNFGLKKKELLEILSELRRQLKIIMHYDGSNWYFSIPESLLPDERISSTKAQTELVYYAVKSFGPITVPQITQLLRMPSSKVSTSLIELYSTKKVARGHFIEDSAYESFIATDELTKFEEIVRSKDKKKELIYLPSNDPLVQYWTSADFIPLKRYYKGTVLVSGYPIFSFNYVKKGGKVHIIETHDNYRYEQLEKEVQKVLQEFAENQGKMLVFPQTKTITQMKQALELVKLMKERGYVLDGDELMFRTMFSRVISEKSILLTLEEALSILLDLQSLTPRTQLANKVEIVSMLEKQGVPIPINALYNRIRIGHEQFILSLFQEKKILLGGFGAFQRGIISARDYELFTRILPKRTIGAMEERVLKILKMDGRSYFHQLKDKLLMSNNVLRSALEKLAEAQLAVRTIDRNYRELWYYHDEFFTKIKVTPYQNQKEAWLEILRRILQTNLPMTTTQLVTLTGLSYNQIERYMKELIATKDIKYGLFIEGQKERQFSTSEITVLLKGYMAEEKEKKEAKRRETMAYISYNDPVLKANLVQLTKRFYKKQVFYRPNPSYYADLIVINGVPAAAVYYKKIEGASFISDLEIIDEYRRDTNSCMIILGLLKEQLEKREQRKIEKIPITNIRNINGIPIGSEVNKDIKKLISLL